MELRGDGRKENCIPVNGRSNGFLRGAAGRGERMLVVKRLDADSDLMSKVLQDLETTTDSLESIAKRNGLSEGTVRKFNDGKNIRTKIVGNNSLYGLNVDKLDEPVTQLTVAEKQSILKNNLSFISRELEGLPEEVRRELEAAAKNSVWAGLSKYSKDLMLPQHFVMLVTRNVLSKYIREQMKKNSIKRQGQWSRRKPKETVPRRELNGLESGQLDQFVKHELQNIREFIEGKVFREEIEDVVQETVLAAYQRYESGKYEILKDFFLEIAKEKIKENRNRFLREKFGKIHVFNEQQVLPHLQNRPKHTVNIRY
jgi:hypothetical protein